MMTIIFDEHKYALELLRDGFSSYMKWQDLFILAKYYRYEGESNRNIRKLLMEFCMVHTANYNDVLHGYKLNDVVKKSEKQDLRIPNHVLVTHLELERIRAVDDYKLEKLLFVMLVISKNNKMNGNSATKDYYVNHNFSTLFPLAKIYYNREQKNWAKHYLFDLGMIMSPEPNKMIVTNKKENYKLLYVDPDGIDGILVTDLNDIISFYKPLCTECGEEVDKVAKRHTMCSKCYNDYRNWVKRESKKRIRHRNKKGEIPMMDDNFVNGDR